MSGGIVGITQRDSTRDQWCLTYNERAQLLDGILSMFGLQMEDVNDDWNHRKTGLSGRKQDVSKLVSHFQRFGVFSYAGDELVSQSTNDVAPEDVKTELVTAGEKGGTLVQVFVASRLLFEASSEQGQNSWLSVHGECSNGKAVNPTQTF